MVLAVGAPRFGRGVDGEIEGVRPGGKALLLDQEVQELLVVLHGEGEGAVGKNQIRIRPFRGVPVHIADTLLLPRVKGQQAEILLVGLVIAPIGGIVQIHRVHGVPGAFEPLVLPGEDAASGAAGRHDVLIAVDDGLPLFLLGHMA